MNVPNWLAFSRMAVTLVGPGGAGDGAGDCPEVRVEWRMRMGMRRRSFILFEGGEGGLVVERF